MPWEACFVDSASVDTDRRVPADTRPAKLVDADAEVEAADVAFRAICRSMLDVVANLQGGQRCLKAKQAETLHFCQIPPHFGIIVASSPTHAMILRLCEAKITRLIRIDLLDLSTPNNQVLPSSYHRRKS